MAGVKNEIIEITKKLIRFKTIKSEPDKLKKCIDFVADYLSEYGFVKRFEFEGKPSLVAAYADTKKPDILIAGHLDVVEASDEQFNPAVKDNKLFGRGAVDMKGGCAAAMVLFRELSKLKPKPSLGLMFTTDEEIGGKNGIGQLVKTYGCRFAIAPEPNHSKEQGQLNITVKHKGTLWLKIKTKGVAAHGSRPWLGENAIDKLITIYQQIKKKFPKVAPDMWKETMNLGIISGGEAPNKIPDKAEAVVDIRWTEQFNKDRFMKELKKLDAGFEIVEYGSMLNNDIQSKYINILKSCAEKTTKKKCLLIFEHGATDMRFLSEKGMAAVVFGPDGKGYHGLGEYLDLNSIEPYYKALKEFVIKCTVQK